MHTRLPIDHCIISKENVFVDKVWQTTGMDEFGSLPSDHNLNVYSLRLLNNAPEKEDETTSEIVEDTSEESTSKEDESSNLQESSAEVTKESKPGENKKQGCKSSTGLGAIAICVAACGVVTALKRKKNK